MAQPTHVLGSKEGVWFMFIHPIMGILVMGNPYELMTIHDHLPIVHLRTGRDCMLELLLKVAAHHKNGSRGLRVASATQKYNVARSNKSRSRTKGPSLGEVPWWTAPPLGGGHTRESAAGSTGLWSDHPYPKPANGIPGTEAKTCTRHGAPPLTLSTFSLQT